MFTFELNENYSVTTVIEKLDMDSIFQLSGETLSKKGIYFGLLHQEKLIGFSRLITDFVDVAHIANFVIDETHSDIKLNSKITVGEAFLKIIFKYPPITRKPEFHFVFSGLEQKLFSNRFKFTNDKYQNIMIRNTNAYYNPEALQPPFLDKKFHIKKHVEDCYQSDLLGLLKNHTYWAKNYTAWKLDCLIKNSECYYLFF